MKRNRTALANNDLDSFVKKQKIEKSLNKLLNEVANGEFDDFRQWLKEYNTTRLDLSGKVKKTPLFANLSNLGKALNNTPVISVFLISDQIGPQGAKDFAIGLKGTQVTTVNLVDNAIGDQGAKDFAEALRDTHVTTVYLASNGIGSQGAKDFAENLKGTKVTTVHLEHNRIGPQGAKDFSLGLKDTTVTAIHLGDNALSDQGIKDLAIGLKDTKVTTVSLWVNDISDEGAKDFGKALKDTQVALVNLSFNKISCQGTKDLIEDLKGTIVTTIRLEYNEIHDEATATDISACIPSTYLLKVNLGFENKALSEALNLNNQKLVLTPYYLACLNYLPDNEKLKYKDLPKLDQASTSKDALKFAGGIFMYLSFGLRKQVLSHLPLIDQKSRANTYLNLAAKRQGKIQIEDQNRQDNSEDANPSRSSSWAAL